VGGALAPEGKVSGGNVPAVALGRASDLVTGVVAEAPVCAVAFALACAAIAVNAPTSASDPAANARVADEIRRKPASRCR
jgi:hypothetical protein